MIFSTCVSRDLVFDQIIIFWLSFFTFFLYHKKHWSLRIRVDMLVDEV